MNILSILAALVVFGLIVMIHELGHFLVAKHFGVTVHEFSIGMGPKVLSRTRQGTEYSLRALPLGGYIRMEGEDEISDDPTGLQNRPPLQKMAIIAAGPLMNFVLAALLFALIGMVSGVATNQVAEVMPDLPAQAAGLLAGDRITAVQGQRTSSYQEVASAIAAAPASSVRLEVERAGQPLVLESAVVKKDERNVIGFKPFVDKNPLRGLADGFAKTWLYLKMTVASLAALLSRKVSGAGVMGPVGLIGEVGKAAQGGWFQLANLSAFISLNLGFFNLLPIPALDGSRIVFSFIELIRGKKIPPEREGTIHMIGMILLLSLIAFVTYGDISRLFRG